MFAKDILAEGLGALQKTNKINVVCLKLRRLISLL